MFSLTYTPAYDPYHTVFRFLILLTSSENRSLNYRTVRAADFFLCFPWSLKDIRAPREIAGFSRIRNSLVKKYKKSNYDNFPSARIVFDRMEMIQAAAVSAMAGADMIDADGIAPSRLTLRLEKLSPNLIDSVQFSAQKADDLVQFLAITLPRIKEFGNDGIYARSGLGEYTYDVF